ncbi:MAG: hypothetical protein WB762_19645 [Candidatus Sulfotelmatobacter sp.]
MLPLDPRWRGDGRELYYTYQSGQLMAVEIATNPEFKPGKPGRLGFATPKRNLSDSHRTCHSNSLGPVRADH